MKFFADHHRAAVDQQRADRHPRPPAVWYIGRQSYMRSLGLVFIMPAKPLAASMMR